MHAVLYEKCVLGLLKFSLNSNEILSNSKFLNAHFGASSASSSLSLSSSSSPVLISSGSASPEAPKSNSAPSPEREI
jgi:hypothetical protein